ncbi:TPA: LOW QUALITY PROTEIN: hypothetical protein N0F65_000574 [Lagenidium giganteum]|uniref:Phosphoglycerate mutase n=1 Tax=Lagenidium giganteum TaxID=4803 RepID=A0AAV2Z4V0_9STRA|nr:TPA: LOW QUALITY PROTEIN: hypothetical protein N0F65_000574 [Lagenidium giganteum]
METSPAPVLQSSSIMRVIGSFLVAFVAAACSAVNADLPPQGNVTFSLRYVPGFFKQGEPSQPLPKPYPPHMGLMDGKSWQDVDNFMKEREQQGTKTKLIIFLRHGEGTHNVATEKYGQQVWDDYYRKLPEYLDTPLTDLGKAQAKNASIMLTEERKQRGLNIPLVIVSPLQRTLQTYTIAYENNMDIPNVSTELSREILGVGMCDKRRSIEEKKKEYSYVDFSEIKDNEDPWWQPDHRETDFEIDNRCRAFMNNLFYDRKPTHLGVVSHSLFGAACLRVLGHREYKMATADHRHAIFKASTMLRLASLVAAFSCTVCSVVSARQPPHGNIPFSLRYVPGFFKQGDPSQPVPKPYSPHMGLVDGKTWQDVDAFMKQKEQKGIKTKLIIFIRHGEGTHNVAKEKYGMVVWNATYRKLPEFIDAPLTDLGMAQAKNASIMLVIVSPLKRTLQTYTIAYENNMDITNISTGLCEHMQPTPFNRRKEEGVIFVRQLQSVVATRPPGNRRRYRQSLPRVHERLFYNRQPTHLGDVLHSFLGAACLRVLDHRVYEMATAELMRLLIEYTKGNVSFSLRYVPGFFKQGEPSHPVPKPYPAHMGLMDGKSWQDVDTFMKQKQQEGTKTKLIIFIRHGEGDHNVAEAKYGKQAWDSHYKLLPEYLDAHLTDVGKAQAKNASIMLTEERKQRGLNIPLVVVSPLYRTLQTYTIAYENNMDIPSVASELARETVGVSTCNARRNIEIAKKDFPHVDFSEITSSEDPWYNPPHRETDAEVDNRCRAFMNHLFYDRLPTHLGVVSHSAFGAGCLRVLGHRTYKMATAEFVPLLIEDTNAVVPQRHPKQSVFTLRYVPGFFAQGTTSTPVPQPYVERMGLLPGFSWADVDKYMAERARCGVRCKLVLFLRHGEGIHNVGIAQYGPETWDICYRYLARYTDPSLTQLGQQQARNASVMLDNEVTKGGLRLDQVIVSPFERTLKTFALAYEHQQTIPTKCVELAREIMGVATCDKRNSITPKTKDYPHIDFSGCPTDEDSWWSADHRETDDELDERARMLLRYVFDECSATRVGFVSHSILAVACLRVLGHRRYPLATAEFVPLLIEETASTMRIAALVLGFFAAAVQAQDAKNVSFSLQYVPGFFQQGEVSIATPTHYAPRMGLLEGKTWAQVDEYIQTKAKAGVKAKLVVFLRHGEGHHNVAIAKYGQKDWDDYYCKLPEFTDPQLTDLGVAQAKNATIMLDDAVKEGLKMTQVIVSPLERTINTYLNAYANQRSIPQTSNELSREILGVATCDLRRPISEKKVTYPDLKFEEVDNEDPWWRPDHRETDFEIDNRARAFLNELFYERAHQNIGVVSHSLFGAAVLRVLGHRVYPMSTAEFTPLLIEDRATGNKNSTNNNQNQNQNQNNQSKNNQGGAKVSPKPAC